MPTGNESLKAAQIVTQRVTVEHPSRRDAAEPIGQAFADLVTEAKANEKLIEKRRANNETDPAQSPESEDQLAFSSLLPKDDDTATFPVANAALSDTSQPVAGLLNLAPAPSGENAVAPQQTPPAHAAPTDILIDTNALFLSPGPSQPIETAASLHQTGFEALSWPLPENITALQAVAVQGALPSTRMGAISSALAELTASAPTQLTASAASEGGPAANRLAANLTPAAVTDSTGTSANPSASGAANTQAAQGANAPHNPAAQTASQLTGAPPPALDATASLGGANSTQPAPSPASAVAGAASPQHAASSSVPAGAQPPALASAPPVVVQVYSRFVERFDGRAQQFQIRLDPPELGRVNVRIEIGADHRVHAVLAAHDSNALSDLLRGQRALEQSLADAGIDLAEDGIKFELSDNGAQQSAGGDQNETADKARTNTAIPAPGTIDEMDKPASQPARWSRSRINLVA